MTNRASILNHVINPSRGDLPAELARYILSLNFPDSDQKRYQLLAEKAQAGNLTHQEQEELDDFLSVNSFLTIVQAKAEASLKSTGSAG